MTLQAVPAWIPLAADGTTQVQHPPELLRAISKAMSSRPGVVNAPGAITAVGTNTGGDFAATVVPAAMQLTVAAGSAFVPGRESTLQTAGHYFAFSEASEVVAWPANASGSTRMDSLILRIDDPQYGSIGGSPLGAWWDPVVGSSGSARPDSDFLLGGAKYIPGAWLRMYDISVPNAATQLTQVNVAFKAGYSNANGYQPYYSTAAPASAPVGTRGYEVDTGAMTVWTGTAWTFISPLFIGELSNNATNRTSTTSEGIGAAVTFTSPGTHARYKATWLGALQSTVGGDIGRIRIRHQSGASLTSAGTQDRIRTYVATTTGQLFTLVAHVTGLAAGQWTMGGTIQRITGTGTNQVNGNATDDEYLLIERIG